MCIIFFIQVSTQISRQTKQAVEVEAEGKMVRPGMISFTLQKLILLLLCMGAIFTVKAQVGRLPADEGN
jgi:hypothetical protein